MNDQIYKMKSPDIIPMKMYIKRKTVKCNQTGFAVIPPGTEIIECRIFGF
jgi:hypothetical protein